MLLHTFKDTLDPNTQHALSYLILDGPHAAGNGLALPQFSGQGLSARAYLYTDRPAYRPGNQVQLRGVVREVAEGRYAVTPGASYKLEVTDSRGRPFVARDVTLSKFGTFHESIDLDDSAPIGTYSVRLYKPGGNEFGGQFEVQAYQLEKIDLEFDLPRMVYYRGETIEGAVVARYQYGTPLAGRPIEVQLPDGRTLSGKTDDTGRYAFDIRDRGHRRGPAGGDHRAPARGQRAQAVQVAIAVQAFGISLDTSRDVYLDDEPFTVEITTLDALGEPVGQELTVAVLKRVPEGVEIIQVPEEPLPPMPGGFQSMPLQFEPGRTVKTHRDDRARGLEDDRPHRPRDGQGDVTLKVDDDEGGRIVVRASGTDRFGNPVVAQIDADDLRVGGRERAAHSWPTAAGSRSASRRRSACTAGCRRDWRCWPGRPTGSSSTVSCRSRKGTTRSTGRSMATSSRTSPSTPPGCTRTGSPRPGSTCSSSATCG